MQILAVIVRYKTPLDCSETFLGITKALQQDSELATAFRVFLWDNTPQGLEQPDLPAGFEYGHSGENLGVSGAYNRALKVAERYGCPWMLLLDQDTSVTDEFLRRMLAYSKTLQPTPEVGSIVPFVRSHGKLVSPRRLLSFNRVPPQIDRSISGLYRGSGYGVNSGSLLRVSCLREAGGFSEEFWLDLSDVYIFQRLYERKRYMYIAGDVELQHVIAGMNFEQEMVPERYQTFLAAENAYMDMYHTRLENAVQTARLLLRTIRQFVQYRDKAYATITWRYFLSKLFVSRSCRLQHWREYLLKNRRIPSVSDRRTALNAQRISGV
jgi:glycosyltransferase involved in cell wall biosynthesis